MFWARFRCGDVEVAFTDRHGGASAGPWSSLDLGTGGGDDARFVEANLTTMATALGVPRSHLVLTRQMHGAAVTDVDGTWTPARQPTGDALVTARTDVALCVRVADCAPLALADPARGLAAVVHVGRSGLRAQVVSAAVDQLRALGADHLRGWLGPRVCGRCYEVPDDMRADVAAVAPAAWATTRHGSAALDLGAGITEQLTVLGVRVRDVGPAPSGCTMENDDLFSYRRQGHRSGRCAVLVRVHPPGSRVADTSRPRR